MRGALREALLYKFVHDVRAIGAAYAVLVLPYSVLDPVLVCPMYCAGGDASYGGSNGQGAQAVVGLNFGTELCGEGSVERSGGQVAVL